MLVSTLQQNLILIVLLKVSPKMGLTNLAGKIIIPKEDHIASYNILFADERDERFPFLGKPKEQLIDRVSY